MMIPASLMSFLATAPPPGWGGLPPQASTLAPEIDFVYQVITWICVFFFVVIVSLILWFMFKYSKPPGTPAESNITHNTPIEVTWTVIPLLLVIVIFYVGMQGYIKARTVPLGAYEINVAAQKWNWQFNYRSHGATTTELIVPAGRPVKLLMSSQDVLHSLYIPAFRVKQDVVPGRITYLWFEVPKVYNENKTEGDVYDLYCAEYCGQQHSTMITTVRVLEEAEFAIRIQEEADFLDKIPADMLYVAGPRLFARCKSCHSLDGTSMTGPSWDDLWERTSEGTTVFSDGTTLSDLIGEGKLFTGPEDYIMQSILNPQEKLVMTHPTGSMPTFQGQLSTMEIQALTDFMKNLDKFDEKTGEALDAADDLQNILDQAKAAGG